MHACGCHMAHAAAAAAAAAGGEQYVDHKNVKDQY
jgi:hypothetical protein